MDFTQIGIHEKIVRKLNETHITAPTPVQERIIPAIIAGQDVLVQSETGSGKTISFALPILQAIRPGDGTQALIIAPTRELALQINLEMRRFSPDSRIRTLTIYGGVGYEKQIDYARRADIIIATPGRLNDLINQNAVDLGHVSFLVLDEADRMLDMGFDKDITAILDVLPRKRQTLFFSATVPPLVEKLMKKHLTDPQVLRLEANVDPKFLKQEYYEVEQRNKFALLLHLLKERSGGRSLIFTNTKRFADALVENLEKHHVPAKALHGDMSQNQRERTTDAFKQGRFNVLIATDVAARGLHVDDIAYVYNYDVPSQSETYVHRIGRTARQGRSGIATTILSPQDHQSFHPIFTEYEGILERKQTPRMERTFFTLAPRESRHAQRTNARPKRPARRPTDRKAFKRG